MILRRLLDIAAMLMIGDSVLTIVRPRRHVTVWQGGPAWWQGICAAFVRHRTLTRGLGAAGLGLGILLAGRAEPERLVHRARGARLIGSRVRVH